MRSSLVCQLPHDIVPGLRVVVLERGADEIGEVVGCGWHVG